MSRVKVIHDKKQEEAERLAKQAEEPAKLAKEIMARTAKARRSAVEELLHRKPSYKRF